MDARNYNTLEEYTDARKIYKRRIFWIVTVGVIFNAWPVVFSVLINESYYSWYILVGIADAYFVIFSLIGLEDGSLCDGYFLIGDDAIRSTLSKRRAYKLLVTKEIARLDDIIRSED